MSYDKEYAKKYRAEHKEKLSAYQKEWHKKNREQQRKYRQKWDKENHNRRLELRMKAYKKPENRPKNDARRYVNKHLIRQGICVDCKGIGDTHFHHISYVPNVVVEVCNLCHLKRHGKMKD